MLPNSTENVLFKVSVRTNVPDIKATPSTIASAVSASRSLWASRPLMVTLRMSGLQGSQGPQGPHPLQDRIGGRLGQLAHHGPVGQEDDPVRIPGSPRIVRHHDDRLADFGYRSAQECQQVRGRIGVQVARGL